MALFARKLKGCTLRVEGTMRRIFLIELSGNRDYSKFVLHLEIVSLTVKNRVSVHRMIHLEETEKEKIIKHYFSQGGSTKNNFPEINDERWQISMFWLNRVARGRSQRGTWIRINNTLETSRTRSNIRIWNGRRNARAVF